MKFHISASIEFDGQNSISFKEPFQFPYTDIQVTMTSTEKGIDLLMEIEEDEVAYAKTAAEVLLFKIANVLSWSHSLSIISSRVTGMTYSEDNGAKNVMVVADTISISGEVSFSIGLGEDSLRTIAGSITRRYQPEQEDLLLMWREVMNQSNPVVKFLLLFRILEKVKGTRAKADKWIRSEEPTIELRKGLHAEDVSVLTYLRDNIHAKSVSFPFDEVENNLPRIHTLARKAIEGEL